MRAKTQPHTSVLSFLFLLFCVSGGSLFLGLFWFVVVVLVVEVSLSPSPSFFFFIVVSHFLQMQPNPSSHHSLSTYSSCLSFFSMHLLRVPFSERIPVAFPFSKKGKKDTEKRKEEIHSLGREKERDFIHRKSKRRKRKGDAKSTHIHTHVRRG